MGDPKGEPVLMLHGTTGSWQSVMSPAFAGELFGPGQPLDASKNFIIIPDSIGHGKCWPSFCKRRRYPLRREAAQRLYNAAAPPTDPPKGGAISAAGGCKRGY